MSNANNLAANLTALGLTREEQRKMLVWAFTMSVKLRKAGKVADADDAERFSNDLARHLLRTQP